MSKICQTVFGGMFLCFNQAFLLQDIPTSGERHLVWENNITHYVRTSIVQKYAFSTKAGMA